MVALNIVTALQGHAQVVGGLSAISGSMESTGKITANVNKLFAALGVTIGVASVIQFGKFVQRNLDVVGGLGELSQQLGVTTGFLQEMQLGAAQAGISSGELEVAMQGLSRRIGEAASGSKEMVDAFNELGVGVLDAAGNVRTTERVLRDAADAISEMDSPAKQAAAAMDLFGRAGQRLLPLLLEGSAGFDKLRAEAERLGVVLDDKLIAQADAASDAMVKLEFVITKAAQTLIVQLAPVVKELTDLFVEWAPAIRDVVGEFLKLDNIRSIASLRNELAGITEQLKTWQQYGGIAGPLLQRKQELEELLRGLEHADAITMPSLNLGDSFNPPDMTETNKALAETQKKVDSVTAALNAQIASWGMNSLQLAQFNALQAAGITIDDERAAGILELVAVTESHREGMEHFNESLAAEVAHLEQASQAMSQLRKTSGEVTVEIDAQWGATAEHLKTAFTGGLGDITLALVKGQDAFEVFTNVALRSLDRIVSAFIEAAVEAMFFNSILGAGLSAGPAGTSSKGGGGGGGAGGFLGGLLSLGSIFAGFFASGTDRVVSRPTLMIAGETGSERVRIEPTGGERSGGGGGTVINMDLRGSNGEESIRRAVMEGIRRAAPGIIDTAVKTVQTRHSREADFLA